MENQHVDTSSGGDISTSSHSGDTTGTLSATDKSDFKAGEKDGQVYAQGQVGADAKATVSSTTTAKHGSIGVTGTAEVGAHASGHDDIGSHGASMGGSAMVGDSLGGNVHGSVNTGGVKISDSTGASIGDKFGGSFNIGAEDHHSKITFHVGGKVSAIVGLTGNIKLSVDTKPISKDYDDFKDDIDHLI